MTGKFSLLGLLALLLFAGGAFVLQLTSAPTRTLDARVEPYGDIQVHLQTEPDPPKTGGIPLMIHLTDKQGNPVTVDQVKYEYWMKGEEIQTLDGKVLTPGTYTAIAGLNDVGEWQVRVTLVKNNQQTLVKFLLRVMPNI